MGTTQFVSVPYALYSGNSVYAQNGIDSVSITGDTLYLSNGDIFINSSNFSGDYNELSNQPITINSISNNGDTLYLSNGQTFVSGNSVGISQYYIGEEFGGGVIFQLWKDAQGVEHGLIVDKTDLSPSQVWSNVEECVWETVLIGAQSSWDGLNNSNAIVGQAGHTSSAAALCLNSTNGGQSDWYLPSIDELSLLWHNRFNVNKSLSTIGGAMTLPIWGDFWSSTEEPSCFLAWYFTFDNGSANSDFGYKSSSAKRVRAIRSF
jgi:hypothetical protein